LSQIIWTAVELSFVKTKCSSVSPLDATLPTTEHEYSPAPLALKL
jgi:hypothetical protein